MTVESEARNDFRHWITHCRGYDIVHKYKVLKRTEIDMGMRILASAAEVMWLMQNGRTIFKKCILKRACLREGHVIYLAIGYVFLIIFLNCNP